MNRPTIRQLEYLIAIEKTRSFSLAAEHCHVTQSTLSAGIKELENILSQPVVNRGRKNITLTAFGTEVADEAREILQKADNIAARAKNIKSPLSGPLRLGIIPTIAPFILPSLLPAIQKEFPALELHLHEDLSDRILQMLNQNSLDLILLAFPFDTPGYSQMQLFEEPFYLACPKGREPAETPLKSKNLNPGQLLLLEDGHCLRDHALSACDLQLPKQRKAYSATSLQTLIQMVSHEYGMTLLPEMAVQPNILPANISIIPFSEPVPSRKIGLCWRKNHPRTEEFMTLGHAIKRAYGSK